MRRVTGIGGIFFHANNPELLPAWYKEHLGIDVQSWGSESFAPSKSNFMINYRVDDLAALIETLRKEGCEVLEQIDNVLEN